MRTGCIIHQFLPNHHTGTEQYARALALEERRRGGDARVFTFEPQLAISGNPWNEADDSVEGIPVRRVALRRELVANPVLAEFDSPFASLALDRWLREFAPDRLQIFHLSSLGIAAAVAARARGIPIIAHATDFFTACPVATLTLPDGAPCAGPPDAGFGCFECIHTEAGAVAKERGILPELRELIKTAGPVRVHRRMLTAAVSAQALRAPALAREMSQFDAIAAPSRFLIQTLAKHGVDPKKLHFLPYGIDTGRLAGLQTKDSGPVVFGYFGTFAPHKGPLELVEAFAQIAGNAQLVLRGRTGEFPQYGARLASAAARDPRVKLGGSFAPGELGRAFSELDILVVPSLWHENTPFVALEAMAAGRPVLASDRGGLSELLGPGRGGDLFEPSDRGSIASTLAKYTDRSRLESLRAGIPKARTAADALDAIEALFSQVARGVRTARG